MRCRGAKVFNSTCPASTAVSSWSNKAKRGTCFSTSGLQAMHHLVRLKSIVPRSGPASHEPPQPTRDSRPVPRHWDCPLQGGVSFSFHPGILRVCGLHPNNLRGGYLWKEREE